MIRDHDTIAAPATAAGGALAVIRISGEEALRICDRIFRGREPLAAAAGYTVHYGEIVDDGRVLDDVLVTVFRAPRSYTGEDAAEISCHGSQYIVSEILRLLTASGARMAGPGEFTIRAYLAGKLDLSQAEAVADMIASSSRAAHALASTQMRGGYSEELESLREKLLNLTSLLELELDFSEEDVEFADRTALRATMQRIAAEIDRLRSSFALGNAIREGVAVAIAGAPNVGKSTLISIISAARPKIANYHFTTLTPVLGVVRVGPEQSFVCADIPGLIEGAAEGVGLGHDFLRHVERCRLLLHVVDVSGCEGRDPKADFEQINHELAGFSAELADRPQIVLGNKCDIASPEQVEEFKQYVEAKGLTFLPISAATRQGVDNLPALVYNRLKDLPPVKVYEAEYKRPDKNAQPTRPFTVERTGDHEFTVDAPWLERILAGTNVEDYESLQYFQTQLGDSGILDELVAQGVEEEDTIKIGEYEFDYLY